MLTSETSYSIRGALRHWPRSEVADAANELTQEYPRVPRRRVTSAVLSALPFAPYAEGRVNLLRRARELLRPGNQIERSGIFWPDRMY
jgi:hypothetical protein